MGGVGLRLLANLTVDASGVDLSQAKVQGLDALEGVIWDMATTWPPLLADRIRAHSKEIREGTTRWAADVDTEYHAAEKVAAL